MHIVPKPNVYDPDHAAAVRAEFAVIYARADVAAAATALDALSGEFERQREHEQHEIDNLRRRMATCSASEKPILEKRLKKHTDATEDANEPPLYTEEYEAYIDSQRKHGLPVRPYVQWLETRLMLTFGDSVNTLREREDALAAALRDIDNISPMEAYTRLYELKRMLK